MTALDRHLAALGDAPVMPLCSGMVTDHVGGAWEINRRRYAMMRTRLEEGVPASVTGFWNAVRHVDVMGEHLIATGTLSNSSFALRLSVPIEAVRGDDDRERTIDALWLAEAAFIRARPDDGTMLVLHGRAEALALLIANSHGDDLHCRAPTPWSGGFDGQSMPTGLMRVTPFDPFPDAPIALHAHMHMENASNVRTATLNLRGASVDAERTEDAVQRLRLEAAWQAHLASRG